MGENRPGGGQSSMDSLAPLRRFRTLRYTTARTASWRTCWPTRSSRALPMDRTAHRWSCRPPSYPLRFRTPALWRYRTDPPPLRIAIASCFYVNEPAFDRPGTPYGSSFEILAAITARRPDVMVWLGDNTYMREADWYTRTGILHRYTHTRHSPVTTPASRDDSLRNL